MLLESSLTTRERHTWFARFEVVDKPAHDLHAHESIASIFTIGKLQGGYVRHLKPWSGLVTGVGGTASASLVPTPLAARYNGRVAPGFGVFVTPRRCALHGTRCRVRPPGGHVARIPLVKIRIVTPTRIDTPLLDDSVAIRVSR